MNFDSKTAENNNDIAEFFRQFFLSIYSTPCDEAVDIFKKYYEDNDHMNKLLNACQSIPAFNNKFGRQHGDGS